MKMFESLQSGLIRQSKLVPQLRPRLMLQLWPNSLSLLKR